MSRSPSRVFSSSSRASSRCPVPWTAVAPPVWENTSEAGPNRTLAGSIVVASKASGRPYSPAWVLSTATDAAPFRLIAFGKPPGLMLIATGTTQPTLTSTVAALLVRSGSVSAALASWIAFAKENVCAPAAPQVIVNVSSIVRSSSFATASAVTEDDDGATVEPGGAVAVRKTVTFTGDDGPWLVMTLRSVRSTA